MSSTNEKDRVHEILTRTHLKTAYQSMLDAMDSPLQNQPKVKMTWSFHSKIKMSTTLDLTMLYTGGQ